MISIFIGTVVIVASSKIKDVQSVIYTDQYAWIGANSSVAPPISQPL